MEEAEEELRRFKRRRAGEGAGGEAGAAAGGGWRRLGEWEATPLGAPPPWALALDGAPCCEGEVRMLAALACAEEELAE